MANNLPPTYRPDESQTELDAEHSWIQGAFLSSMALGIQFVLRHNMLLFLYISVIFVLLILYTAGVFEFTQLAFINGRNIPGGPFMFEDSEFSLPIDMLVQTIMVMNSWLCDIVNVRVEKTQSAAIDRLDTDLEVLGGLFRLSGPDLAYHGNSVNIGPWLNRCVFGVLYLSEWITARPPRRTGTAIKFNDYAVLSLSLNFFITVLIVGRLLYFRRRIVKALGKGHGSQYTSVGVATLLIISRVAIGRGWTTETRADKLETLIFNVNNRRSDEGVTRDTEQQATVVSSNSLESQTSSPEGDVPGMPE
ncbi:hypothetical protein NP233_g7150 [Leucocoprinus birnbaumii]|uniref:Uncharacterized protein n=1 Tax=Leucocoprinus birnbaumii TaxID=56174 RepID=A0AAD5VQU3_9AGAR|nr:hypothetical protein NP233_g7150 [Leucocoprinus birnbaumii]